MAHLKPGGSLRLEARALDEQGTRLLCPPDAIRWECPPELGRIDAAGRFRAAGEATAGWVSASLNGTVARVPLSIGSVPRPVADFEEGLPWVQSASPAGAHATTEIYREEARSGSASLRLRYNFTGQRDPRVAAARALLPIGKALGLRLALLGDGSGSALRARVRDARGRDYTLELCPKITWKDTWREVSAPIPDAAAGPLTLEVVYLVQNTTGLADRGAVLIDDVRGDYAPEPPDVQTAGGP
jgi:hypothetical protein